MAAAAVGSPAIAQQFTTWRVDHGGSRHRNEVGLRVSPVKDDVMVAWHEHVFENNVRVHYNTSVDGVTFQGSDPPTNIPIPSQNDLRGADPMVVFTHDNTGRVGYFANLLAPPDRFWIAEKEGGQPLAQTAVPFFESGFQVDKGVLVAGPPPGGGPDQIGLVYVRQFSPTYVPRLRGKILDTGGATFPIGADAEGNKGGPNGAVILRSGQFQSRWVVAYYTDPDAPLTGFAPAATYSDNNGQGWFDSSNPRRATVRGTGGQQTEVIHWTTPAPDPQQDPLLYSILPAGGPFVLNSPSIFADPLHPNWMYMAFTGRATSGSFSTPQQMDNIDLFIAKSEDGGANFTGSPAGTQVLRLRDDLDLTDPPGSIQFLPAITVDSEGAIHVFYYVAYKVGTIWKYKVKMASLSGFSPDPATGVVWTRDLTLEFDMEGAVNWLAYNRTTFGDYIMADARGCEVWVGYVARPLDGPSLGTYVTKVNLCVDADLNHDGLLTGLDPVQFTEYFVAGHPRADLNRNSQVDSGDVPRFLESFACGCNPP